MVLAMALTLLIPAGKSAFAAGNNGQTIFSYNGYPLFDNLILNDGSLFIGSYLESSNTSEFMTVSSSGQLLKDWKIGGQGDLLNDLQGNHWVYTFDDQTGSLKLYTLDGQLKWEKIIPNATFNNTDQDGNIFLYSTQNDQMMTKVTPTGSVTTFELIPPNDQVYSANDGSFYQINLPGTLSETLVKYHADGTVDWEKNVFETEFKGVNTLDIYTQNVNIGDDGVVYLVVDYVDYVSKADLGSQVIAINSSGNVLWRTDIESSKYSVLNFIFEDSLAICTDNSIYFLNKVTGVIKTSKQIVSNPDDSWFIHTNHKDAIGTRSGSDMNMFDQEGNVMWTGKYPSSALPKYVSHDDNYFYYFDPDPSVSNGIIYAMNKNGGDWLQYQVPTDKAAITVVPDSKSKTIYVQAVSQSQTTDVIRYQMVTSTNAGTKFTDVKNYLSQINFLTDKNIIKGYQDGTFKPENDVTRLQAVQMILNQMGIDPATMSVPDPGFKDMKPGDYGYEAAAVGASLGIIHGKQDGTFNPDGHLTRGQMAAILANAYHLTGQYNGSFTDIKNGVWPFDAVNALAANNITKGYADGSFRPDENISRQHFAVFLYNYLTGVGAK